MIKVGDMFPFTRLTAAKPDGPKEISTEELFAGRKVVLFATPGAFTPTCSARHLPGYLEHLDAFHDRGVDKIACLSVNDAFVMSAWARDQGVEGRILMLADGAGQLTKTLGLELDLTARGLGIRSQRYAMIVEDKVISSLAVEEPGQFDVSRAETVLDQL